MPEQLESELIINESDQNKQSTACSLIDQNTKVPVLELLTDFLRSSVKTLSHETTSVSFPGSICDLAYNFADVNKIDLETVLLTNFANLLHRYSNQDIFCIGVLLSNQISVIKVDFSDEPTFLKAVSIINLSLKNPLLLLDLPFDTSDRIPFSPLLRAVFYFRSSDIHSSIKSPEHNEFIYNSDITAKFTDRNNLLSGTISTNSGLFKKTFTENSSNHFLNLLEDSLTNPDKRLSAIKILSKKEEQKLLYEWNSTEHQISDSISIPQLFEQLVSKQPDAAALIESSGAKLTISELNSRSNQLANFLCRKGVKIETPIAVCMERSIELIVAISGILKAGGTYVPIDPAYPAKHIDAIIRDCNPVIILTKNIYIKKLPQNQSKIVNIDSSWNLMENESNVNPDIRLAQDNRCYIMYTSGSSGKPKGVEGIYKGLINRLYWMWDTYPYSENDICCHKTSIGFVDHIAEIMGPLLKGVPVFILSDKQTWDAAQLVDILISKRITRILLVPSMLRSILELNTEKLIKLVDLQYIFSSAEGLPLSLVRKFYQKIRNARLVNLYGSTEVSADVTYYEIKRFFVADVLKYFTQSIDFPGDLKESFFDLNGPLHEHRVTTADIPLDVVAAKFRSSKIEEFPLTLEQYFKKISSDVLPNVINTAAPTFIGHMTSALPDFVHDLSKLISQLNQNLVKIETAKSLIFLEREALAILHRVFYNRDDEYYSNYVQKLNSNLGLVTTGGSTANITALLTARNKALFGTIDNFSSSGKSIYSLLREKGYEDMTILGTRRMHYSIRKAISVLGLGIDSILYVATDCDGKLDTADLVDKIELCRIKKILILSIIGIAGATETGQIDPLEEIGKVANENNIHFHVDAAWGGTTIFSDKYKGKLSGIDSADSITFCGHKQLYLPQGISICLFKNPDQLQFATTTASYQGSIDSYDVGKFSLEGSRSAISMCLHAALRLIGRKGYEALVNYSMYLTTFFAKAIQSSNAFELIGYPALNIVNYRYIPVKFREKLKNNLLTSDENLEISTFNRLLQEKQFLRGKTFVSKTLLTDTKYSPGDILVFRTVLSNPLTTYADLYEVLKDQLSIAKEINPDEGIQDFNNAHFSDEPYLALQEPQITKESNEILVPIGRPLYNCKTYILDKHLQIIPPGIPGDLYIAGAALARGYLNNRKHTEESFIRSPFHPDELLFKTGDRARYSSDGIIEFLGRHDDQVKINGYRIELAEIEYHISQIVGVIQNKVIVKSDSNGGKKLIAVLVLRNNILIKHIEDTLIKKIPQYMQPSLYRVVDKIPMLPNGKVDKIALLS